MVKSDAGKTVAASPRQPAAAVPLKWLVASVDRRRIDLEALRPYLTEYALTQAATRHLHEHGPHKVSGVSYEQSAAL